MDKVICKNCGKTSEGNFCSHCGQKTSTDKITFRYLLRNAINTITNLDRGLLYNFYHLTIDFRNTVMGYLDGKRIQVFNPISYAIIGVSLLLIVDAQLSRAIPLPPGQNPLAVQAQLSSYNAGYEYGKFLAQGNNFKYFWLLGILAYALPAALFYRQRKLVEHFVIQAFVIGHSAFLTLPFFPLFQVKFILHPALWISLFSLNIWAYWKMDRQLNSILFTPIIIISGFLILVSIPFPIHYAVTQALKKEIKKEVVMDGLKHPWSMAFLNEEEVLLSEKDGILKRINLQTGIQTPIQGLPEDLVDDIRADDQRDNAGLFEILLDPGFNEEIRWVYLSYAAQVEDGTTTKVIRAELQNDSLQNMETLLEVLPARPDRFHYGGGMVFGKDDRLYISVGERFYNEKDQPDLPVSQDATDARGMIYRINSDGSIPSSNPNFGPDAIPGAYAIGIRATQGLTVNPNTGEIWFTDHGSVKGDEINVLKAGANYGWPIQTSGKYRNEDYAPPSLPDSLFVKPFWYWIQTTAPNSLHFYTGEKEDRLESHLLVAGLAKGSLWSLEFRRSNIVSAYDLLAEDPVRLRKVIQSPEGELYILTDEPDGKILRLSY